MSAIAIPFSTLEVCKLRSLLIYSLGVRLSAVPLFSSPNILVCAGNSLIIELRIFEIKLVPSCCVRIKIFRFMKYKSSYRNAHIFNGLTFPDNGFVDNTV